MRIAFTAPMKPLDDPVPSGDRTMGRLIVQALERFGHEVRVASRFRSWRKEGGVAAQQKVEHAARTEANRIAASWRKAGYRPDLFLTYHLYHKAPDWIGPTLADVFEIPYMVVEASRAPKRASGPWSHGFAAADAALRRADMVAALHHADLGCLEPVIDTHRLAVCAPFLNEGPFFGVQRLPRQTHQPPRLLAVGMMRDGDKANSYRVLAEALCQLDDLAWNLTIVGDGPARDTLTPLFPVDRTQILGALDASQMPQLYARHDVLVWPAIREAFGFVFLEAQASGIAVVGGDTFGVPNVVAHARSGLLSPEGDADAFAANLRALLSDHERISEMGDAARRYITDHHTLAQGAARLNVLIERALQTHDARSTPAKS